MNTLLLLQLESVEDCQILVVLPHCMISSINKSVIQNMSAMFWLIEQDRLRKNFNQKLWAYPKIFVISKRLRKWAGYAETKDEKHDFFTYNGAKLWDALRTASTLFSMKWGSAPDSHTAKMSNKIVMIFSMLTSIFFRYTYSVLIFLPCIDKVYISMSCPCKQHLVTSLRNETHQKLFSSLTRMRRKSWQ